MKNPLLAAAAVGLLFVCALCRGADPDPQRYISIDEIRPGMEGWALTVLEGTKIEKFPLKVLSIVRNAEPGMDYILVVATDEVSRHVGAVQGCSGSPVYFDGRMAGALAATWDEAIDPLYLVRPIADMLKIETSPESALPAPPVIQVADLIDLPSAERRYLDYLQKTFASRRSVLPLAVSLPDGSLDSIQPVLRTLGFQSISGSASAGSTDADQVRIIPGGVLGIPLCSGDISISAVGTATEVIGDKVFGFGHDMLGYGAVELPMSAGIIHTTIARRSISFKFASTGPILGTLTMDRATGVYGIIGQTPPLLPLHIRMERLDVPEPREFHCQVAVNQLLTPLILRVALLGASQVDGQFPLEHSLDYEVTMQIAGQEPIRFANVSTDSEAMAPGSEIAALASLLMTNPYQKVDIQGVDVSLRVLPRSRDAEIWSAEVSETKVKAGQWITARVVLQSYRTEKTVYPIRLQIPADLKPGPYVLQILPYSDYLAFQQKASPQRFAAEDLPSMLKAARRILQTPRNQLTAVLLLGGGGIAIRNQELPDLPASRAVLLQDPRRFTPAVVMQQWVQTQIELDRIPSGNVTVQLTVEP